MLKATKLLIIPVLMVMLAVLAAGCGGNDVENMTADDVRQILADSVEATTEADSFTFTMNAGISANVTGEAGGSMSADMSGSGAADLANESMKFSMDASASVDMGFFNMSFDDIDLELYKVGDWVYQHVTWPEQDSGWTKTPAGCDDDDSFGRENMREQLSFVEFPAEVEMLREEQCNGEDCYVIRLVPDAQKLADALSGLPESPGPMTNTELQQLEDTLENTQFTVWIAKDSKLFMKFILDASIDTSDIEGTVGMPTQTDAAPIMMEGDAIMNIDLTVTMADYNKEVEITLPPEAADAKEVEPGSLFSDEFSGMFGGGDPLNDPEVLNELFKDTEFGELFKDGEPDMEKISELFGNGDLDLENLSELSDLLEDEDLDLMGLFDKVNEMNKETDK